MPCWFHIMPPTGDSFHEGVNIERPKWNSHLYICTTIHVMISNFKRKLNHYVYFVRQAATITCASHKVDYSAVVGAPDQRRVNKTV